MVENIFLLLNPQRRLLEDCPKALISAGGARIEEHDHDHSGSTRAAFTEVFYQLTRPLIRYQLLTRLQLIGLLWYVTTSLVFYTRVKTDNRLNSSAVFPIHWFICSGQPQYQEWRWFSSCSFTESLAWAWQIGSTAPAIDENPPLSFTLYGWNFGSTYIISRCTKKPLAAMS